MCTYVQPGARVYVRAAWANRGTCTQACSLGILRTEARSLAASQLLAASTCAHLGARRADSPLEVDPLGPAGGASPGAVATARVADTHDQPRQRGGLPVARSVINKALGSVVLTAGPQLT